MSKIKLVVLNEHTLGYIHPNGEPFMSVLHGSVLKGSPYGWMNGSICIPTGATVRLATTQDFDEYRVSSKGFTDNPNEYEYATT